MAAFTFTFDTDKNQMASFSQVEVPVRGPEPVTTLVSISGIVVTTVLDIPGADKDEVEGFEVFIETQYRLPQKEDWVDGAAFAWLAAIDDDDRHGENGYWIETIDAQANVDGRVQLHMLGHLKSDARLDRIGYQVYVLGSQHRPHGSAFSRASHPQTLVGGSSERPPGGRDAGRPLTIHPPRSWPGQSSRHKPPGELPAELRSAPDRRAGALRSLGHAEALASAVTGLADATRHWHP